jgi:hypothetical protein
MSGAQDRRVMNLGHGGSRTANCKPDSSISIRFTYQTIRSVTEELEVGIVAEHLLNNRPQMRASSATGKVGTLTKQTKIGLCEQVRVN